MFKLLFVALLLLKCVSLIEVSYYEILGVSKLSSAQEIRQAYKKLAIKYHPDKNPGEAEQEKFLKITEAYETLKDPDKRHKYDVYGSYPSYTRKYEYRNQAEYNNLYYNGLYHEDPYVETLSGSTFSSFLKEGFHFVNFYSPFCPPCQNLVDHWKKIAEIYKGIVRMGAVNCKYYNNFCYNSMRIGSYPTLLFYPNGKRGNYLYYRGDRTVEALDDFIMSYLRNKMHVPVITQIRNTATPIAYVLGRNRIEDNALTRIAFHLNGLVTLAIVEDDNLREKLTKDEYTTVVFKHKSVTKQITSTEENVILDEIVNALPKIELIDPERLKVIRNELRSGHKTPWVLYFSTKGNDRDRLQLYQMSATENMHFGEIKCDMWGELCASLQAWEPPCWGVLKVGGAYQRVGVGAGITRDVMISAASASALHSLSASDLQRILEGDVHTWVLAVVPHKLSWEHLQMPLSRISKHFQNMNDDISFGIMVCSVETDDYCRQITVDQTQPTILVQKGAKRHYYTGDVNEQDLLDFIQVLQDSDDMDLSERQILEIMDASVRDVSWLVAYLPAHCQRVCDAIMHEWRILAKKLRPLEFVRVGAMQCTTYSEGFCGNVRSPTVRLYPYAAGHYYTSNLQNLAQAPYMLEWALSHIDDSVVKFNSPTFNKYVLAEELNPTGGKKPWLIYFHSPRCYRCYEMYADFAVAGILLQNAVQLGKVNCMNERGLCQHEQITSYPSLRLYLGRNKHHTFSSIIPIQVRHYSEMLNEIKSHIKKYDPSLITDDFKQGLHMKHDEF